MATHCGDQNVNPVALCTFAGLALHLDSSIPPFASPSISLTYSGTARVVTINRLYPRRCNATVPFGPKRVNCEFMAALRAAASQASAVALTALDLHDFSNVSNTICQAAC